MNPMVPSARSPTNSLAKISITTSYRLASDYANPTLRQYRPPVFYNLIFHVDDTLPW